MKKILLTGILLILSSTFLFSQSFGGIRALRTQVVGGFQNGIGLDAEYTLPILSNKLAVRTSYSMLPFSFGKLPIAGLTSDFDLKATTFDFGLKYYLGGDGYSFFLGVDYAMDSKDVEFTNIKGATKSFQNEGEVAIEDGKLSETISSTLITPKLGWTNISVNGFTWSFELGYSIANVDPIVATVNAKDAVSQQYKDYKYEFKNLYEDLFGMKGLPYVRLGFGYAFRLQRGA